MRLAVFALSAALLSPALHAADAACKPVRDADLARAAKKTWHMSKTVEGMSMQTIRVGNEVWNNMGGAGWKKAPPTMAATLDNAAKNAEMFAVSGCKKLGSEKVGSIATTIYTFTTAIPGLPPATGKVWIGDTDGLPYREQGEGVEGTTVYEGVSAPK